MIHANFTSAWLKQSIIFISLLIQNLMIHYVNHTLIKVRKSVPMVSLCTVGYHTHQSILALIFFFKFLLFSVMYHTLMRAWQICVDRYIIVRDILHTPILSCHFSSNKRDLWFNVWNHTLMRSRNTMLVNGSLNTRYQETSQSY